MALIDKPLHLAGDSRALRLFYFTDQTKYVDLVTTSAGGLTITPAVAAQTITLANTASFNVTGTIVLSQAGSSLLHVQKPTGATGRNTVLGLGAGAALAGATISTAVEGSFNTFVGDGAGAATTTGRNNTWVGRDAGAAATTGESNTGVGSNAGLEITTGQFNVAIGKDTGRAITTGNHNTFVGFEAGRSSPGDGADPNGVLTGSENTGVGLYAGRSLTTADNNTLLGSNAGRYTTTGEQNVFVGSSAAFENITGADNVAIGQSVMRLGTVVNSTVAIGREALYSSTVGANVGVGYMVGRDITSGTHNTLVGYDTGRGITTGIGNTVIGGRVSGLATGLTNNVILATGDGTVRMQFDGTNWNVSSGHLLFPAAETSDIGASGATRPRTVYVGTSVLIGARSLTADGAFVVSDGGFQAGATGTSTINAGGLNAPNSSLVVQTAGTTRLTIANTGTGAATFTGRITTAVDLATSGNDRGVLGTTVGGVTANMIKIDTADFVSVGSGSSWQGIKFFPGAAEAGRITSLKSWVVGTAALATDATDGFFYIPASAGAPTGTPTAFTGRVPLHYDSTNNEFYVYNGGWKKVALA